MRRLVPSFRIVAAVGTVFGVALALWSRREGAVALGWADARTAAAAVALFAVAPLVQALAFWILLRALSARAPLAETALVWSGSFLLRYAPSGMVGYAFRVRECSRLSATRAQVVTASVYEQLVAVTAGAAVCVTAFLASSTSAPRAAVVALVAAAAAAAVLRSRVATRLRKRLFARSGVDVPSPPGGRALARAVAVAVLGWPASALAVFLVVAALAGAEAPSFVWLAGAYALAWLVGFAVPFLPAGLGARDATLVALLAVPLSPAAATAIAVSLRLAATVGELVAVGFVEAAYRIRRTATARRYLFES